MISFIIIGKNEGWKLSLCLEKVYETITFNKLTSFEVIYVDSQSNDDSIERAKQYKETQIFQLTGNCNAAIARNIGAHEAQGEVLFFLDGDMELHPKFLSYILKPNQQLVYPFISGIYEDHIYDSVWNFVNIERRYKLSEDMADNYEVTTGGLFVINKKVWDSINGMDERLVRSQDLDLGLRMAKNGIKLLRKPLLAVNHHTIPYLDNNGIQNFIRSATFSALLSRKHIFNKHYWSLFLHSQYSALSLGISLLGMLFITPFFSLFYVLVCMYKSFKLHNNSQISLFFSIWAVIKRDVIFLFSFFFYFPRKPIYSILKL